MLRFARTAYPGLPSDVTPDQVKVWMGHRPSTPDGLPCIGPASGCADVVHAFGHGHVGLTAGPMTGKVVAAIISDRPSPIPLAPYSIRRFA
jgi:D-amino-acid dehydrogenase